MTPPLPLPSSQDVLRFRQLIAQLLGLNIDELRLSRMDDLLRRRAQANHSDIAQYLDGLATGHIQARELALLTQELTVTETYFFRNPDQFAVLTDLALPARLQTFPARRHLNILSAACASGEEAYSIAIAIREYFPHAALYMTITAIDFNPDMLEKAQRAQYSSWSLRDMSPARQTRWFSNRGSVYALAPEVQNMVKFERLNLAAENPDFWHEGRFDIVFCRNVLMYFTREQAQAAIRRIAFSMTPDGYLFMGHAETLRGLSGDFHLCHTHDTFYYQRKDAELADSALLDSGMRPGQHWQEVPVAGDTSWIATIRAASERIHAITTTQPDKARLVATNAAPAAVRNTPNLEHAMEYLHKERFDRVLEQIGTLPEEHAQDTDVLLLKAVSLCHSGASAAAEETCQQLLSHDELNAGAHYVLALCRESAGDIHAAMEQDQMAAYLDPGFAMPRLHMGLLAHRKGDQAAASLALTQALPLLLQEDSSRILLFGGGFKREALVALCRAQLDAVGAR
ncbi:CheR family methyltransferase [Undibacterium sp.]|uniref:CheR family methyltransferase n=1 Tax=Undibacterium sp. TaxID=1914977 RepID=UPI00374D3C7B